ncbi:MAG: DNA polymerase [Desulfosporosinus sp.]|nr:DNA polymerase [Desulfosporosinus sp.]
MIDIKHFLCIQSELISERFVHTKKLWRQSRIMRIIKSHERTDADCRGQIGDWIYNGLDVCVTREVFDVIHEQLDQTTGRTYAFSRDLQGPVLEMRCRGVLVDALRRHDVIDLYHQDLDRLERQLDILVLDGCGLETFKWSSPKDLRRLFYDILKIPEIKSKGRVSTDVTALEKMESYLIARQIVRHILTMREYSKRISVLRTPLDPDGRMRSSYNIAGTNTGRFSSSFSEFGTGGNLQNVEERLRSIFVADPGMKFAKCDAKSGESYAVGAIEWNLFGDGTYLDAVESGDVHTAVAKLCWPDLEWSDSLKFNKELAEQPFYRHYSYRFMCKKLGHGSNYGGAPFTLATQSRLPLGVVQQFQPKYFAAFPAHRRWQEWVAEELLRKGHLTTLTGRRRWFHGRRNDSSTIREAIAYDPQGSLADIVNTAMLNIWREGRVQIVMHDHDALTFQYPEEAEDEIIPYIMERLAVPVPLANGRVLNIPYDCKVGWNKGDYSPENLEGLKDYDPTGEKRKRQKRLGILDRPVRGGNR